MNAAIKSNRAVTAVLLAVAVGMTVMVYNVPQEVSRSFRGSLVAIGVFNALLHRKIGEWGYRQSQAIPPGASFWRGVGKERMQSLYLGIGVILVVAGFFAILKSA